MNSISSDHLGVHGSISGAPVLISFNASLKMSWMKPVLLTCLMVVLTITLFKGADTAAVSDKKDVKAADPQGSPPKIFMSEADASNFFKRRSRRATKTQDEINAEQRQRQAADLKMRQYHEEQRNEFENYAEEEHDEQDERTRESTEQWREFHHDGLDPSYEYNRHTV
ncbi:unique cartilage matrix-associated protein [Misgurnus anguillicaudatus]|uniref:unique cartilage matrix-associated protein n=1 Tax=Misgurnus anguillicaudatus TaxID=75329 RepID=UPI003CCF78D6